ncbi:MAG: efflux RND transporter periplasmic adaptor subunit [Sphingomonadaceae bacterium]|nr:efflux RND transporter periplasmic adaptor subunit [Sphingomonadaceae bacterium]
MAAMLKRWRWALLIAALLALGLAFAFWPRAVLVDAGQVSRGRMVTGITDDGQTRAVDVYVVSAPVTGYLDRIELDVGDPVARGALITRMTGRPSTPLDPRSRQELLAAGSAARAGEAGAKAALDQSWRDLQRAEKLAKDGFLPRSQLEAARTRVAADRAALAAAQAEVRRIEAMLAAPAGGHGSAPVAVIAPASGSVLTRITESEGVIAEGTPLVMIGNPDRIEGVVDLLSREAVRVKPGDRVEITQWGGPVPLIGTVKRIEPFGRLKVSALGIEEQRVNVIIGFSPESLPDAARLGHGYQFDATFVLWSRGDALRVPIGALFRGTDGEWHAFEIVGGRAIDRKLKIGQINEEWGEVLGGLSEGAQVVVNPSKTLSDRARVKAR